MLTKTRKWLFVFILAVAAVFLAACGKKEEPAPNPTKIEISLDTYEGNEGVLIGGEKMELSIITTPENAIKTVTWSSADSSIATVSQDGKVTGLKGGKVKIKAVSTVEPKLYHEIEVLVYEDLEDIKIVLKAMEDIKAAIPTYVTEDLPLYQNENNTLVKIEYFYTDGTKVEDNLYKHVYVNDTVDTLNVKLSYLDQFQEFPISLNIVQDDKFNEFEAVNSAKAFVDGFLKTYKEDRITENVELPLNHTFDDGENTKEVAISWTSPLPTIFSHEGVYNRPNDDTVISLEAYFVCGNVNVVSRTTLTVNGYTQAEKMAYLKDEVLPKVTELEGANVSLPLMDTKYGTSITWTSNLPEVLSTKGKMDPFLATETNVILTATIKYTGASEANSFEETVEFPILVKPAANDAQKVALDFGNSLEGVLPTYFPYGSKTREGNTLPLPTTVGGDGNYKDIVVSWTADEAGLFNETWELQKQYLRFHEVTMTYAVTVGDATATGEVNINVGVAKSFNTIYIGGDTYGKPSFDEIHTFSQADQAAGTTTTLYSDTWGGWSGITIYRDILAANGSVVRYQFMLVDRYIFDFNETNTVVDENGLMSLADAEKLIYTNTGHTSGGTNRYKLFVNNTGKDMKMPIAFLNYKGSSYTTDVNGDALSRHLAMNFDGWRTNFVVDATGKIVIGYGNVAMETGMLAEAEATNTPMKDYALIPAGGIGFSANQNAELAVLGDVFMQQPKLVTKTNAEGVEVTEMVYGQTVIEYFTPII